MVCSFNQIAFKLYTFLICGFCCKHTHWLSQGVYVMTFGFIIGTAASVYGVVMVANDSWRSCFVASATVCAIMLVFSSCAVYVDISLFGRVSESELIGLETEHSKRRKSKQIERPDFKKDGHQKTGGGNTTQRHDDGIKQRKQAWISSNLRKEKQKNTHACKNTLLKLAKKRQRIFFNRDPNEIPSNSQQPSENDTTDSDSCDDDNDGSPLALRPNLSIPSHNDPCLPPELELDNRGHALLMSCPEKENRMEISGQTYRSRRERPNHSSGDGSSGSSDVVRQFNQDLLDDAMQLREFLSNLKLIEAPFSERVYTPPNYSPYHTRQYLLEYMRLVSNLTNLPDGYDILIYYVGHGADHTGDWLLGGNEQISFDEIIEKWLKPSNKNLNLTLVLDCCQSGHWVRRLQWRLCNPCDSIREYRIAIQAACDASNPDDNPGTAEGRCFVPFWIDAPNQYNSGQRPVAACTKRYNSALFLTMLTVASCQCCT